jgi:hypothetical protein
LAGQAGKEKQNVRIRLMEKRGCILKKWRERLGTEFMELLTSVPILLVEGETGNFHMSDSLDEGTGELFMRESERLLRTVWVKKKMRSYENCPVKMKLAFCLSSASRPAFHLFRDFPSLPCQKLVFNHFAFWIKDAETQVRPFRNLIAKLLDLSN